MTELLSIIEASEWASEHLKKKVSPSNISYLIQYGKIKKYHENGNTSVNKYDLIKYYKSFKGRREIDWKNKLGKDLNWALSFDHLREKDTTKHVHRLHPYKGKFIPQLVEYFLDDHIDNFKKEIYFKKGDIVLDPFAGSGTTLVQANELGIHAIGIDISPFNTLISNTKIINVDFEDLANEINVITNTLNNFIGSNNNLKFENELNYKLSIYNKKYFPSPDFKIKVRNNVIKELEYAKEKEKDFLKAYEKLVEKYNLKIIQDKSDSFLDKWYLEPVRKEIDFVYELIKTVKNNSTRNILMLILSRTMRSTRATTHADLATLKNPVTKTYYCKKHGKICKPLFTILNWWERYSNDTLKRLYEFKKIRTDTYQICLQGDSRNINLTSEIQKFDENFANLVSTKKIQGIFSSPPYVGLINYHEQHAYAYDLFGFNRFDDLEIGPLFKGQGKEARESYINGISQVLINLKKYLQEDYNIFLVANDKYNLYPKIAENAGMQIVNRYKRPVLNRTEKDKSAYSEIIFHLKRQNYGTK